ncbi:MAG: TIGR02444 family protein [Gammaproteobacteria bacterium]
MATPSDLSSLPQHPFWTFSCQVYAKTQNHLLSFQNRYDLNINVLLFCFWFAANNACVLAKHDLKVILTSIHVWHKRIVLPLRQLRSSIKRTEVSALSEILRPEVLEAELTAEYIEELLIVDAAPRKYSARHKSVQQRVVQACQNLLTYCQSVYVTLDDVDCQNIGFILHNVFPDMMPQEALELCQTLLLHKQQVLKKPVGLRQMQLEF